MPVRTDLQPKPDTRVVVTRAAIALLLASAFVSLRSVGDPYQPVRTAIVAFASAILLCASRPKRADARWVGAVVALVAVLVLSAVSNGWASAVWGVHGRFDGLVGWAAVALAGLGGWALGADRARDVSRLAGIGAIAQTLVLVLQAAQRTQPGGSFGNQVIAGGWLAVCVALAVAGGVGERGAWRAVLWGAAGVGALGLGIAGSRGAWAGLAAGLAAVLIFRRRAREIAIAAGCAAVVVVGALSVGGEAATKISPRSLASGSASARAQIWIGALSLVADRPLLGAGPGRFLYVFPRYEPVEHARVEGVDVRADQAHSRLVHVAAEAGLPTALAWMAVFAIAIASGVRGARSRSASALALLAGLSAYLGQAAFSVHAVEADGLGFLLAGMLAGSLRAQEEAGEPPVRPMRALRWAAVVAGLAVTLACAWYLRADRLYLRSLEAFERGDMRSALAFAERAVRADPLTDVYRVAHADAAAYLGPEERAASHAIIEEGLGLEPDSYDLALARARLLRLDGSPEVSDAYLAAASLYPNGVEVRREAIAVCLKDGRLDDARRLAGEILRVLPGDPEAGAVLGAASR